MKAHRYGAIYVTSTHLYHGLDDVGRKTHPVAQILQHIVPCKREITM